MKSEILKMLRDANGYVSGQELCDTFQVSRTAVWKAITKLKEEGYEIEAVRNKGYHLLLSPDILSLEEIKSNIKGEKIGQVVEFFGEIDSTNIHAKKLAENGCPHGTLVVADQQNGGKGRRGRGWNSPKGTSVFMSLVLRPDFLPDKASMLTLVMAYSATKALKLAGHDVVIKWPNDLVMHGKKVSGILTEMSSEVDFINYVVVGVGINVNNEVFPEELKEIATSLKLETKQHVMRGKLIGNILAEFEIQYKRFCEVQDLSFIQEEYNHMLVNCDRQVRILEPNKEYEGKAIGINASGELLVVLEDGEIKNIYAGEVSVRGIYGYV